MNYINYEKWLKTQLIPNLPPSSVLVIDNAPFHNVQLNPAPTSSSKKQEMIDWLTRHGIPFTNSMYKPELYTIIKIWKPKYKMYKVDALLAEKGHSVLRLPPYHPDLNPIELIWGSIKEHVAKRNVNFQFESVLQLVREKCDSITADDWTAACRHSRQYEDNYMSLEPFIDDTTEELIIRLGDDSDSDDDDIEADEDGDENSDGQDYEESMSGIDIL